MSDNHSEPPRARNYPTLIYNLAAVCITGGIFVFGGLLTSGLVSTGLFIFAVVVVLYGGYLVLKPPTHRFEVGTFPASHQYNGVTITAEVEIQYDDEGVKRRTVECAAVAEDGTTIVRECDTEPVGTKPDTLLRGPNVRLDGGDFDGVQSTSDHILAVSAPIHEYVDEWHAAEGNDLAVKAALETEFDTTDPESDRA